MEDNYPRNSKSDNIFFIFFILLWKTNKLCDNMEGETWRYDYEIS